MYTHSLSTNCHRPGHRRWSVIGTVCNRFGRDARRRRMRSDLGQTALLLVVGLTVLMSTIGAVMVSSIVNNEPILSQTSIQRYAYRALASGLNAYTSAINADPYLASCNADTNPGGADATSQCAGISYGTWSTVPDTTTGNGVVPEYYKFDNPQQVDNSSTYAITELQVQIVGAAGYNSSDLVYYSTIAHFVPANGFLNNVWWTNYESTGTPSSCKFYWTGYPTAGNGCTPVYFDSQDNIKGPIFSNDSIYVDGGPNFGSSYGVTTADPYCQFVDPGVNSGSNDLGAKPNPAGSNTNCEQTATAENVTYDPALSSYSAKNYEQKPADNSELGNYALQDGCYYTGPTTITLNGTDGNSAMTVTSLGTSTYPNPTSGSALKFGGNTSTCPTDGSAALPANGVIYVAQGGANASGDNPFDGIGQTCGTGYNAEDPCTQTQGSCTNQDNQACYYGATGSPNSEGDAFVQGNLSGQLTIAANNDIIIQGPITYADCTWSGGAAEASTSPCEYNSAIGTTPNDTLGLIAYNYVEVSRPINNNTNTVLPYCGANGALAPPLCNPATSGGGGLVIDASILGLNQSFIVNNYDTGNNEGQLTVYGSIQQDARGPVAELGNGGSVANGYGKTYTWDPRLALYSPPYYLTPGTPSWALTSSAESYCGVEPAVPPAQSTPSSTQPAWPVGCGTVPNGWTAGSPA
jgi:hypothetical protein